MMWTEDLDRLFAYGAQLDAWAAIIAHRLARDLPDYAEALEQHREEELEHNRILAHLAKTPVPTEYAAMVGSAALTADVPWNVAMQNFVERRSEVQFRLAWRETRNRDLLHIANDEARHVRLGREIMRDIQVPGHLVHSVFRYVESSDHLCQPADISGLRRLNQRILAEMLEACAHV